MNFEWRWGYRIGRMGLSSSHRRPNVSRNGELPHESYISHMRVGHFRNHFQHCYHSYIFLLNTFIALVGTHKQHIVKIRISKCPLLCVLWHFENRHKWIKASSFLCFFFLLAFQFPRFLNTF